MTLALFLLLSAPPEERIEDLLHSIQNQLTENRNQLGDNRLALERQRGEMMEALHAVELNQVAHLNIGGHSAMELRMARVEGTVVALVILALGQFANFVFRKSTERRTQIVNLPPD